MKSIEKKEGTEQDQETEKMDLLSIYIYFFNFDLLVVVVVTSIKFYRIFERGENVCACLCVRYCLKRGIASRFHYVSKTKQNK